MQKTIAHLSAAYPFQSIRDITDTSQRVAEMLGKNSAQEALLKNQLEVHQSWLDMVNNIRQKNSRYKALNDMSILTMQKSCLQSIAAEHLISKISFENMTHHFNIESAFVSQVENSIDHVMESYKNMIQPIKNTLDVVKFPNFIFPGAAREFYASNYVLKTLTPLDDSDDEDIGTEAHNELITDIDQETSDCVSLLKYIDDKFVTLYLGARDALNGDNADKARHALTSLREMLSHLLRRLAPDTDVKSWVLEKTKMNNWQIEIY